MVELCPNSSSIQAEMEPPKTSNLTRQLPSDISGSVSQHFSTEEKEHLQVYLRVRPFTTAETINGESQESVIIRDPDTVILKPPSLPLLVRLSTDKTLPQTGQRFNFSQVYGPETTQKELFEGTVKDLVKDVLEGGNSLVFTYGATNAGKTFTFLGPDTDPGILPRSLDVIFSSVGERGFIGMSIKPHCSQEFIRLTAEQQSEEALFKRNLFRQLKEIELISSSLLNSTNTTLLEESSGTTLSTTDRISLDLQTHFKFSVWVSFCEIYNENIHDLLEVMPSGASRRTVLRLSQDIMGRTFVKDLRWVQVNNAEEAYKILVFGKKNQSFSATRLNQLSSRSHSIFSIRILKIEDLESPKVHTVSELSLCDLAGSERCAKTQNTGERLKEAGNINTSLLILGKCINSLRNNKQAKLLQHVPFRESKLTHYLQSFFCGRGKVCMIVNINQCASMYDETLNVLKLSAVAQKVVILSSKPFPTMSQSSVGEMTFIESERKRKTLSDTSTTSNTAGSYSSLEDVQEDDEYEKGESLIATNGEEENESDEKILISKHFHLKQVALLKQLQLQLKKEQAENTLMEAKVREEVGQEFTKLFSEMQDDFNERLLREREILEERAEKRHEIFKDLIHKMTTAASDTAAQETDNSQQSFAEMVDLKKGTDECLNLCRAVAEGRREVVPEELERKLLVLSEQMHKVQQQWAQKHYGEAKEVKQEENELLLSELLEKSVEISHVQKQLGDLHKGTEGIQEKEEVLASLHEEQKAREEAHSMLDSLKKSLEAEKMARIEAIAALEEAQQRGDKDLAALSKEKSEKEELQSALEVQREEVSRLIKEGVQREQEANQLQEQVDKLTAKLEASQQQATSEMERAEKLLSQLEISQAQLIQHSLENREKTLQSHHLQPFEEEITAEEFGDLKKKNLDFQSEVAMLRAKISDMEAFSEQKFKLQENCRQEEEVKMAELQKTVQDKEGLVMALQKSLQKAQEQQEEEKTQAVQEARRREAERRRELLAVAHEAIAHKDEELLKKAEEINDLKENAEKEAEKVKSLTLDLQRREEDTSDLREKLADYKKQMQQVQKEISTMREEEKALRQKLCEMEKTKKQLQCDLTSRDRTIMQLRAEQSDRKPEQTLQLYQKTCKDLEAKERMMEDMRIALTEQEETQSQMEEILEDKLQLIQELSDEVEKLKGMSSEQDGGNNTVCQAESLSHDLKTARQEAAQAKENLNLCTEKHQAERRKWQEEKLSLIGQAKEAEDKRNQEMRKFIEDRERFSQQQRQLDSLSTQLVEKEQMMEKWRKERDTLVAALEVQLQKLLSSQAEKDKLIQQLQRPPESSDGSSKAEILNTWHETAAEPLQPEEDLNLTGVNQDKNGKSSTSTVSETRSETTDRRSGDNKETRASVSSLQSSAGGPSVLDSFEISHEHGRTSRFPRPELEISFSPLQPNRMALRRQGQEGAVTVKITHSARKRKSEEIDKEEVEVQNRRNMRGKLTPKLTPHKEEISTLTSRQDSKSSICSRKEGTLQKIGEFLHSSPTLLGTKAKKMMSLVSGHSDAAASSSSFGLTSRKSKRRLYRPEISSPMEVPPHPIISREPEDKDDHLSIKRRLRSRMEK
ncbi:kinesin-like protein KIF20B isoform X3 [Takifugu flavidus]|uniref:Kinesin-like protein KIF20B n=1 Tax=Takifugu flavidus TaxID=433684 RepID=A0A5C6PJR7_9TELE|nr:kinesin-like protein KIF20B isoform X3 [Takifugu flavidus]TWW78500.1 Kinesin-like protein KIF20B [Takifugu flavidus]